MQIHPEDKDRIAIEALIEVEANEIFFREVLMGVPFTKMKPAEARHVTLGFIHGIHRSETRYLRDFLQDFIDSREYQEKIRPLHADLGEAGHFPGNDTVVIFVKNRQDFLTASAPLREHLSTFEGIDQYDFNPHTHAENYVPHLSVGWDGENAIQVLNERIKSSPIQQLPIGQIRARILNEQF